MPADAPAGRPAPMADPEQLARQRYLTNEEAAAYLRFPSVAAFVKWSRRQALPCCKRGRNTLHLRTDLEQRVERTRGPLTPVRPRLVTRARRLS